MTSRISLVTVCFNSSHTIRDTLSSVAAQSVLPHQHIVIDGGSRDGTQEILAGWRGHNISWSSSSDRGIYDAMNKGVGRCNGDVIGFINADDTLAHHHVLEQITMAFTNSERPACFGDIVYIDDTPTRTIHRWWRCGTSRPSAIPLGWVPAHPAFYVRTEIYRNLGAYDHNLRLAADHEYITRLLARHHIRAVHIPEIWVCMRLGGATNSTLGNIVTQNKEIIRGLSQNGIGISPLFPIWKVLDRIRQRRDGQRLQKAIIRARSR